MLENIIAEIVAFFLWLINYSINSTVRFKSINEESIGRIHKRGQQIIFAVWHAQSFPLFYYFRNKKMCILPITAMRGKIINIFAKKYGHKTVLYPESGSPGERIQSMQRLLKTLKEGYDLGLGVDGPPNPEFHKVKPGVLYFAQKFNCPLVPAGIYMEKKISLFWRWDKYEIPLPFSRVVIAFGEPFEIPAELEVAELKNKTRELEERLEAVNRIAAKEASKPE